MFTTEVNLPQKSRPTTTGTNHRDASTTISANIKLKMLKDQAKALDNEYSKALTSFSRRRKSIDNCRKQSQKVKVNFLKLYEHRKMKILGHKLDEDKKYQEKSYFEESIKNVKHKRIKEELRHIMIKQEKDENKSQLRQKHRKEKLQLRQTLSQKKTFFQSEAKQKFEKRKNQEYNLLEKKRKMEELIFTKSRQNYLKRMEKQLAVIQSFDNILQQAEKYDQKDERSESFFVTNNPL